MQSYAQAPVQQTLSAYFMIQRDIACPRGLPTVAARVRSQVISCRICGGHIVIRAVFLQVLRYPLPIFNPLTAPAHYHRNTAGKLPADVASGLRLTPPHEEGCTCAR